MYHTCDFGKHVYVATPEKFLCMWKGSPPQPIFREFYFISQKRKMDDGSSKSAESAHTVPISPSMRFRQPLSSPSALYPDMAVPLSPTSSLGNFPGSTGIFGRTISAGVCMCVHVHVGACVLVLFTCMYM